MSKKLSFLPYQKDWINYPGRFALCEKSRRTGITYAEAYRMTRKHAGKKVKGGKSWFSSADLSASEEYIDYVAWFAKYLDIAARFIDEVLIDKEDDITAHRVTFAVGGEVNAISSNPTRFRSKGGDITLDEFAHHKDQKKMFTASKPSAMWGGDARIISTHNGDDSYFNGLIKEIQKGKEGTMKNWKLFTITLEDAIKQGLVDTILGHKASPEEIADFLDDAYSGMTQEAIDEEFGCKPRSSSDSHLLPYEIINPCESDDILNESLENVIGDLYVGVDIARKKNFTIIWIDEKLGDVTYARKIIPLQKMKFRDQKEILYGILNHPNTRRCCIDATGIGANLAEDAALDFGIYKVEECVMNNTLENELATDLYVAMESIKTRIPRDKRIRDDFYSIKCVTTSTGKKSYKAPTAEDGSHADWFWAKTLANRAAKTSNGAIIIMGGKKRESNSLYRNY